MSNTPFQDLLKAYFENDVKIQNQLEGISRIGRSGTAEMYLRSAASPLTENDLKHVDQLYTYTEKKEGLRKLEADRNILALRLNDVLSVIPNKKVLYTKKIVVLATQYFKDVKVAIWSDGSNLQIEEVK